jgi:hypothetical protein
MFLYPGNAKRAIQEDKCTNPVITYKVVAITHKVLLLLLEGFELNFVSWFWKKKSDENEKKKLRPLLRERN